MSAGRSRCVVEDYLAFVPSYEGLQYAAIVADARAANNQFASGCPKWRDVKGERGGGGGEHDAVHLLRCRDVHVSLRRLSEGCNRTAHSAAHRVQLLTFSQAEFCGDNSQVALLARLT